MAKKRLSKIERSIPTFVDKHRSRHPQGGQFVSNKPKATKAKKR